MTSNVIPLSMHAVHSLPITARMALAVSRWWFWALRADCSGEWDHVISRLEGAMNATIETDELRTLRFLRDIAAEHSERCYHDECTAMSDLHFLKPQAD